MGILEMYDIIVINKNKNHPSYKQLILKYPFIKVAKNFDEAKSIALTDMFWIVWDTLTANSEFDFKFSPPDYDKK